MLKKYIIKKVDKALDEATLSQLPKVSIDYYPWDINGYKPRVEASVCYSDSGLNVNFTAWENKITVKSFNENGSVYKDSCVEFFLNPMPEKGSCYLNFETNAAGVLLLGLGSGRNDWGLLEKADHNIFGVRASVPLKGCDTFKGPFWTIAYTIPFEFIKEHFIGFEPKPGKQMEANFYKCGDDTEYPHYGCWSPINVSTEDFHLPEFFGSLILE